MTTTRPDGIGPMPPHSDAAPDAHSRGLCHGTGLIYQMVGTFLAIGACCWGCVLAYHHETPVPATQPEITTLSQWFSPNGERLWAATAYWSTLLAGLGITGIGIGLNHDRLRRGWPAMAVTGAMAIYHVAYLVIAIWQFPRVGTIATALLMGILWTVLFLLAGACAEQLRLHPLVSQPEPAWTQRDEDDLRSGASPHRPDKMNP